jgi:PII-like signaling protein
MKTTDEGMLLRIFVGEADSYHGKTLYEQIVLKAKELGLSGATVLRGIMGFGADSRMHTTKLLSLSENLPLVIEIIDSEENLSKLMPFLNEAMAEGLMTLEKVKIVKFHAPLSTNKK